MPKDDNCEFLGCDKSVDIDNKGGHCCGWGWLKPESIIIRHSGNLLAGIQNPDWYELHGSMASHICREKRSKDGKRKWKIHLIEPMIF